MQDVNQHLLKELSKPSFFQWLWRTMLNWLEIVVLFYGMYKFDHWATDVLGILLIGTRQHALALLGHEAIHRNISKNFWINDGFGNLFNALPLFQSLNFYKGFHLDHHSNLLTDNDPEIHFRNKGAKTWELPMSHRKRYFILLKDLSGIGYLDTRHALPHILKHTRWYDLTLPLVFWAIIIAVFVKLNMGWIPWYWTLAFMTSYWAMFRQRAITEHIGTTSTHKLQANYFQRFFFLPHNTWYHYEHHECMYVPCWNLPQVRSEKVRNEAISVKDLYHQLSSN